MASSPTVVIGAGIVGLSTAYFLARRGAAVTVLDDGGAATSASTGNAGLVSLGHPPLPRPGLAGRALRWMLDGTSPLYIPPRLDPALVRWLWRFHGACRSNHFRRCMDALGAHGHYAGACFRTIVEDEAIDCGYTAGGQLEVYRTDEGRRQGDATAEMMRSYGYAVEHLDAAALREREPAYRDEVVGASLHADSAFASPRAMIAGLRDAVVRHGAVVRADDPVDTIAIEGDRCAGVRLASGERVDADQVVLAAGIWSTALARRAGVRVPMQAGKGYHVDLDMPTPPLRTAAVLAEDFVAVTPMDGALRLAGTLEFSGINDRLVARRLEKLATGAARCIDGVDAGTTRGTWCGLRPCTADGMPVIGWAPRRRGLFLATGHAMMGFTLGPLTGHVACACLLGEEPRVDLRPYDPARFA